MHGRPSITYTYDFVPLENVPVYLFTAGGAYLKIATVTDSQGRVRFSLPKTDYKVRTDYLSARIWSEVFNTTDATVNIHHGRAGVHVFRAGVDIYDASVYVFTAAGAYLGKMERTDSAGMVSFLVPEGAYKFRLDHDGRQTWSDVISILAHEETIVEMDLDILVSDLTRSPDPVRFDGVPSAYEPKKTLLASLGSVQGALDQVVNGQATLDKVYFFLNDQLGAPRMVVDDAGAIAWQADYKPFGGAAVAAGSRVTNQFRFPGQYFDQETGLHYNYHRYYDPRIGRYITKDPSHSYQPRGSEITYATLFILNTPSELHSYVYVQNNPMNWKDPSGLQRYRRDGETVVFGRDDSWIQPGDKISTYLTDHFAHMHKTSEYHDWLVNKIVDDTGIPDFLANYPTMIPSYAAACITNNFWNDKNDPAPYFVIFQWRW